MRHPRQTLPLISVEPLHVSVRRGGGEESCHAVDVALVDAGGVVLVGLGDVERSVFPRSAMKPLQAIALAEKNSELPPHLQLTQAELALICASHNGQQIHRDGAVQLLEKFGLSADSLSCGAHWSRDETTMVDQVRQMAHPERAHNNCSGKHSGMLVLGSLMGVTGNGYAALTHPVQQAILGVLEAMTGTDLMQFTHGVDGCGAPALSGPLGNWARGFALFAGGGEMPTTRTRACALLRDAIAAAPQLIAGDRRLCSALAATYGASMTAKVGAEGVYGCAFHELGLGLMMKARDGNCRAVEVALGAIIHLLGYDIPPQLHPYFYPKLTNWDGERTGEISVSGVLAPEFRETNAS